MQPEPPTPRPSPGAVPDRIDGLAAARHLFAYVAAARIEVAAVAYLDRDRRVLGMRHVRGTRNAVDVDARLIAIDALTFQAEAVIMAHNHPSGDPHPSRGDLAAIKRLVRALDALNVRLLDHLILAGDSHSSMRSLGML